MHTYEHSLRPCTALADRTRSTNPSCANLLRRALLGDRFAPLAGLRHVGAEGLHPRQRGERLEAEDALEERCRAVADRAVLVHAPALADQPSFDEAGDDAVDVDAADSCDLRPRDRAEVRDDRERLERRL